MYLLLRAYGTFQVWWVFSNRNEFAQISYTRYRFLNEMGYDRAQYLFAKT